MTSEFHRANTRDSMTYLADLDEFDIVNAHSDAIEALQSDNSGLADYNNTGDAQSLTADVWTTITNDGAGAFTNLNYLPSGVDALQQSPGYLDFTDLRLGSAVIVRVDISVTPSVNGASLDLRYQLGTGAGTYYLPRSLGAMSNGGGIEYRFVEEAYIYMGDLNTRDNPGLLQLRVSEDSSVQNAGWAIQVIR